MSGTFKSLGIVFKTMKYSESSVIVDIYTKEKGLRSFIVSGLNSKKNKSKATVFQHLNIIELVGYDKSDGTLARIKEQKLHHHFTQLPYDIKKSSVGLFMLELSRNTIQEAETNEALYHFVEHTLIDLDQTTSPIGSIPLKFTIDLTKYIGITPRNNWSETTTYFDLLDGAFVSESSKHTLTEEMSGHFHSTLNGDYSKLDRVTRNEILDAMLKYYAIHIEQFKPLNTLKVFRDLF